MAFTQEPLELFHRGRRHRRRELVTDGVSVERCGLSETSRNQNADGPFVHGAEQLRVSQKKHPKVHGHVPGHEVEEHMPAAAAAFDTDRKLIRKVSNGF